MPRTPTSAISIVARVLRPQQVLGRQALGLLDHVVPVVAALDVLEAELGGHLDAVVERVHPGQVGEAVLAPDDQRDPLLHGDLDRIGEDPAVGVPVHVAHHAKAQAVELLEGLDVRAEEDVVAAEALAQVAQVAQAHRAGSCCRDT